MQQHTLKNFGIHPEDRRLAPVSTMCFCDCAYRLRPKTQTQIHEHKAQYKLQKRRTDLTLVQCVFVFYGTQKVDNGSEPQRLNIFILDSPVWSFL